MNRSPFPVPVRTILDKRLPMVFGLAVLVLLWYGVLAQPKFEQERARVQKLHLLGAIPATAGSISDRNDAQSFVDYIRRLLPQLDAEAGLDTAHLLDRVHALDASLETGTFDPRLYGAAIAALQRVQNQLLLDMRGSIERGEMQGRWLAGAVGIPLLILVVFAIYCAQHRTRRPHRAVLSDDKLSRSLFELSPLAVSIADNDERIVAVNPAFCRVTGFAECDVLGKPVSFNASGGQDEQFYAAMRQTVEVDGVWTGEIWQRRRSGEVYTEKVTRRALRDRRGRIQGYLTVGMDLTPGEDTERLLNWQARHDPLTKLPNRTLLHELLSRVLARAERNAVAGALLVVDVDRFKLVNESIGPALGDRLLVEIGTRIGAMLDESDTVARLGADEFAVLLPYHADREQAELISRAIIAALTQPYHIGGHEVYLTPSIGVALFPQDGNDAGTLIQNGDTAAGLAKSQGGNQLLFYQSKFNAAAERRLEIETHLRRGMKEGQLELFYQPIIDQRTLGMVAAEALIRWRHPKWGLVSPGEFIPVAEETGLITEIGKWIVIEATHQVEHWQALGFDDFRVSLNLSSRQLQQPQDVDELLTLFRRAPAGRFTVEITESILMEECDVVMGFLNELRKLDIRVALDDFGTGFSSLSYLRKYPFDVLKVDRSFVADIHRNTADLELVSAIVSLGRILGLDVVAEGVETPAHCRQLREVGCDLMQGFLFARPMPGDELPTFVRRRHLAAVG